MYFCRIEQFIENGLFDKWMADTLNEIPTKFHSGEGSGEKIKNLRLNDLQSIFYICIIGLLASILIYILEVLYCMKTNMLNINDYIKIIYYMNKH